MYVGGRVLFRRGVRTVPVVRRPVAAGGPDRPRGGGEGDGFRDMSLPECALRAAPSVGSGFCESKKNKLAGRGGGGAGSDFTPSDVFCVFPTLVLLECI